MARLSSVLAADKSQEDFHSSESESTLLEQPLHSLAQDQQQSQYHLSQPKSKLSALRTKKKGTAGQSQEGMTLDAEDPISKAIPQTQQQYPGQQAALSSSSMSSSSIFERSVTDQATMSSISRRNSSNKINFGRSLSFSLSPIQTSSTSPSFHHTSSQESSSHIPLHLTSENFIPTCLDATTELLNDKTDLSGVEVIQSCSPNVTDLLDQQYYPRRASRSVPLTRRQSNVDHNTNSTINSAADDIDYTDRNKLNFCSFADLLGDEIESGQLSRVTTTSVDGDSSQQFDGFCMSPVSRKNSSIFVGPALGAGRGVSIEEEA